MPHTTLRIVELIDNDADESASDSAPQLPVAGGTRAPQSTPAGGNTPQNNTPANNTPRNNSPHNNNNSPRPPIDAESCAYGTVIVYYGGPNVDVTRERIKIELDDGTVEELYGQNARDATGNAGSFVSGLTVQVTYFGGTNKVKEIRRCEVKYGEDGRIIGEL